MPSPVEIEVLLAFWYDPNADMRDWNPGQHEFISRLLNKGMLKRAPSDGRIEGNHEALALYIEAITDIPLPQQRLMWTLEE